MQAQTAVSTSRTVTRFIARLLVGVLVFAQTALAAYACQVMNDGPSNDPARLALMGVGYAPDIFGSAMGAGPGAMDPAQPNLCVAHYQFGQQNAERKPAPKVPDALPASLYPLVPLAYGPERAFPPATTNDPPPRAGPPHATLHCCLRI